MDRGQKLKELIKEQGRTLTYVSEKACIPYDTLSAYIRGASPIPDSKLLCICLLFDIDPKIFGLDDKNFSKKAVNL